MTVAKIEKRAQMDAIKYEVAESIREALDQAARRYNALAKETGGDNWTDADVESEILALVTDE